MDVSINCFDFELIDHEACELVITCRFNPNKRSIFITSDSDRQSTLHEVKCHIVKAFDLSSVATEDDIEVILIKEDLTRTNGPNVASDLVIVTDINQLIDSDVTTERISFKVNDFIELRLIFDRFLASDAIVSLFLKRSQISSYAKTQTDEITSINKQHNQGSCLQHDQASYIQGNEYWRRNRLESVQRKAIAD